MTGIFKINNNEVFGSDGTFSGTIGTNATLPDGTMCGFTETTTTPTNSQGTDTNYTDMTGSSVSYTPVTGSSFVVYDYTYFVTNKDNNSLIMYSFYYDGSEVANTNNAHFMTFGDGDAGLGYKTFTFVLPSWSGAKILKMQYKALGGAYEGRLHQTSYSGDGTGTDAYVNIYRRTYSVM